MTAEEIQAGLMRRGLPAHVANAFVMNFQDESGLDPGINEQNPTVPGSRGGFGLYQLTGPRRRVYEQFAADRGVPVADADAQLDYLMYELQGPESRAARSIMAAPDTASAAVAIARDFLRPAPENLARRTARYSGAPNALASMGQPSPAPGNALAAVAPPEPDRGPQMPFAGLDAAPFQRQPNALQLAPVTAERRNILARYA